MGEKREFGVLVGEIVLHCIVVPPGYDSSLGDGYEKQTYRLSVHTLVTLAIFARIYHVCKFLYSQSSYHSQRAHFYS